MSFPSLLMPPFNCSQLFLSFLSLAYIPDPRGGALFLILIIIICLFFLLAGHHMARGHFLDFEKRFRNVIILVKMSQQQKEWLVGGEIFFVSGSHQNAFKQCQTWKIQLILMSKWYLRCMCCSHNNIALVCTAERRQGHQGLAWILESFPKEY